ncbi:cysteinyl-tRNA synthetase [Mortierella claussenii]|nr:cysteinyl-tRNA synthetase [Mortierella claussenii]
MSGMSINNSNTPNARSPYSSHADERDRSLPQQQQQQQQQQFQQQQQQQRTHNGRSHLDTLAQAPILTGHRRKNTKEGNESSGLMSFFRTPSRPPSPDPHDHFFSNNHARKTSFSGHSYNSSLNGSHRPVVLSGSMGSLQSNSSSLLNSTGMYGSNGGGGGGGSYNGFTNNNYDNALQQQPQQQHHNVAGQSQSHPFDLDTERRRSTESYSRSSSPDRSSEQQQHRQQQQQQLKQPPQHQQQQYQQQQHPFVGGSQNRHPFPTTPPAYVRPHQRTDSIKNAMEAQHRRTKSTDFGETFGKRSGQDQEPPIHAASPAKETKKNPLRNLFKKRPHLPSSSSTQHHPQLQQQSSFHQQPQQPQPSLYHSHKTGNERSRKCSADDPHIASPQTTSTLHAFSMALFPDHDYPAHNNVFDKRHGHADGLDTNQRALQYMTGGKKGPKKDQAGKEAILPSFVVDLNDMSGIQEDPRNNQWRPISPAAIGAETWLAPESWGVQPPSAAAAGAPRSLALTPEGPPSEDLDQSDYENWDYGEKKLTIKIFRPDTTYSTFSCALNTTASELSTIVGKKVFTRDTSKFRLYMLRNNIVRPLGPHERPLSILRKLLMQFGYTDQDKLEELSGKDNSFICRFTFAEHGAPLTTEVDLPDSNNYADIDLQRRCLPTIPIFLYLRAKDIVRLNISHNQRMDLPLDFVQNCSVLREVRMAYNDLDRVPSNIRSIVYLQVLDLRGNRIKSLEKARLEEARELVTLLLQSNRLETLPDSFEVFEHLRILNLSSNNFSKVPMVLCQLTTLEDLDLSFNEIAEIPEEIARLVRLRRLLLFGNRIGPHLPKSMSDLTRLRKLDIRQNGILNLEALNDLSSLEELLVDYNTNVILNSSFKSLTRASFLKCSMTDVHLRGTANTLTFLDMSFNKLSNLSPAVFEHLQHLEILKLDHNNISSIPSTIGLLKRLKVLSISNNLLSALPKEMGQLESLDRLDVHSNTLSELPEVIWQCSLTELNASSNLLESFPDPPKIQISHNLAGGVLSTSSSMATLSDADNMPSSVAAAAAAAASVVATGGGSTTTSTTAPSPSRTKPLPAPPVPLQSTPSGRAPHAPPLAQSLLSLWLGDNRLPDDVLYPVSQFMNLLVLNLSHNYIGEIPRGKIPNPGHILELHLSGNQLTSLPAEDIERLRNLRVLHVNGNKLTTLPAELGKINRLGVLDVGCNMLKYNISNWPYDWNWNWNLELKYLNMSGNKRLQIKRQNGEGIPMAAMAANMGATSTTAMTMATMTMATSSQRQGNLSEFSNLTRLRILGLMDVTITDNVPENSIDRRVRTSMSTLHNMAYGMADTLGDSDTLCIWDLVHPKFQANEDESLFGLFDGRSDQHYSSCTMTSYLKDRFGSFLKIELEKLEGADTVVSALRRTFLGLDRELWPVTHDEGGRGGASALVAYIKGVTLYCANVGDAMAVLVKKSDKFHVISHKHNPWNPTEASRIKRSGGFVSEKGLVNDELDISRSFGQYHLVPCVNSNPFIETTTLSEDDDFLIMASNAFWNVMSYSTAVDIAKAAKRDYGDLMYASQKLRDIAISYGATEHMVVMLIGVGDLFKKKELSEALEYHQPNYKRPKAPEGPADALKYLKPEIEPPQGDVAMVFTDIKNSTKLWENIPTAMRIAIQEHFHIMRRQLRSIGGYEVKNEGDALMASFSSVPAAVLWCFKVQELLVVADWPQDILDSVECRAIFNSADPTQPMYRGLSVRMGIHWGRPVSDRDAVTRRMDYYGPMVNRAARICDSADGGEICVSSDVVNVMLHLLEDPEMEQSDSPQAELVREIRKMGFDKLDLGERKLKGLETPEILHLMFTILWGGRLAIYRAMASAAGGTTPLLERQLVESTAALDPASVQALQMICLRLERLASGATAKHGRVPDQSLALLSLPIKDNVDQEDLSKIAENYITRIENCFSQLYMTKSGHFVDVFDSLGRAIDTDPAYILRALQMYVSIMGGLDAPNLL